MISRFTITTNQRRMIIDKLKSKNILPIFDYVLEKILETIKNMFQQSKTI